MTNSKMEPVYRDIGTNGLTVNGIITKMKSII